jgi:hypothetical protein
LLGLTTSDDERIFTTLSSGINVNAHFFYIIDALSKSWIVCLWQTFPLALIKQILFLAGMACRGQTL